MTKPEKDKAPLGGRLVGNVELARYLGVTPMCVHRWKRNEDMGFPAPFEINGREMNDLNQVDEWLRAHVKDFTKPQPPSRFAKNLGRKPKL